MFTDGRTDRRRTDARLIAISPEPFGQGIKIVVGIISGVFLFYIDKVCCVYSSRRFL